MVEVILSSKYKDQGYVDLIFFEISSGEVITFKTTEQAETFNVTFVIPSQISDSIEGNKSFAEVSESKKAEFKFIEESLPAVCLFEVIRTDINEETGKTPAKMIVKAIITRNG